MSNLSRKKWLFGVVILLIAAGGYWGYLRYQEAQTASEAAAGDTVQTARVRRGDIVLYANGTGTLAPAYEVSFGFETGGYVTEVFARVGDKVSAGDVLAQLDDTDAQARLAQAERNLRELTSETALAQARFDVAAAEENLNSKRNTLAWLISPGVLTWTERLEEANQHLAQLKNEYGDAPTDEEQAEIDQAQQQVKLAQANLKSAQSYYHETYLLDNFAETTTNPKTGEVSIVYEYNEETGQDEPVIYPPSQFDIDQAWAEYKLAKARLQEAQWYLDALNGVELPPEASGDKLAKLEQARQDVLDAQDALDATRLIAPVDGTLLTLDVTPGERIGIANVVTIGDLEHPCVDVYLDEIDWDKIAVGYDAEVTFDAVEDKVYTGKVIQVYPALAFEQNTPLVHGLIALDINQSGLRLPVGAAAAVDVIGGRAENVLLVPVEALKEITPGQYAVFVMEDGQPTLRMVEVGLKDLFMAEIKSGLQEGDIVTTGIVETEQ